MREEVVISGDGFDPTPALAVVPANARRGVVVIHEMFGRTPEMERVVDRFAAEGYAAVLPEIFRAPSRLACVRRTVEAIRHGRGPAVAQARGVRRWLCERAGIAEGRVGIIGFCFGGGFALAVGGGWGAISTNYGGVPEAKDVLRRLGPTIGCYGGRDLHFGRMGHLLEERLRGVSVEVETHTYPEAGHSFLTDGHHPLAQNLLFTLRAGHHPDAARDAWRHIFAFFDRHLASEG